MELSRYATDQTANSEPEETFQQYIARERQHLNNQRDEIRSQIENLNRELATIDQEFAAIQAYEAQKTGKSAKAAPGATKRGGRRSGQREAVLELLRQAGPMSRSEILEEMGLKGDKPAEMSVSNALTALKKTNRVTNNGGQYQVV